MTHWVEICVSSVWNDPHTSLKYKHLTFYLFSVLLEHPPALSDRKSPYFPKPPPTTLLGQGHENLVQSRLALQQEARKREKTRKRDQSTNVRPWVSAMWGYRWSCTLWWQEICSCLLRDSYWFSSVLSIAPVVSPELWGYFSLRS